MTEKLIRETQVDLTTTSTRLSQVETDKLSKVQASATYLPLTQKGAAGGVAALDSNGRVPGTQIPFASASGVGGIKSSFDPTTATWTVSTEEV